MNKDVLKRSLLAKLPEGALRQLVADGDEDRLYNGIAEALEGVAGTLGELAVTREPSSTTYLKDLQREYGFLPDSDLPESYQRGRVKSLKYAKRGSGTAEAMQEALRAAGFTTLEVVPSRQDDDPGAIIAAWGDLVVNGFEYLTKIGYGVTCRSDLTVTCADPAKVTCAGKRMVREGIPYAASTHWNLLFLVSSGITVDEDGYITSMDAPQISRYYRDVIREIILRLKPTGTWGIMAIDWTEVSEGYGFGFFPMGVSAHGL